MRSTALALSDADRRSHVRCCRAKWRRSRIVRASRVDEKLIAAARRATRVTVLTGAGVSAESGIPTFRDKQTGLWEKFDVMDLATPEAFERDPSLVWGWYEWRRAIVKKARPNPAHRALAALEEHVPQLTLVTQNVDDLHERAGSQGTIHLHGSLEQPRCVRCETPYAHPEGIPDASRGGGRVDPPRCVACGGHVRPGVVWFGEPLPELEWLAAVTAASTCEIFLSIGTSSLVQPAASLIEHARGAGALTVQVNLNPTDCDMLFDVAIQGAAGEELPRLFRSIWGAEAETPRS
jgi:NAD-dependent deacetylase